MEVLHSDKLCTAKKKAAVRKEETIASWKRRDPSLHTMQNQVNNQKTQFKTQHLQDNKKPHGDVGTQEAETRGLLQI